MRNSRKRRNRAGGSARVRIIKRLTVIICILILLAVMADAASLEAVPAAVTEVSIFRFLKDGTVAVEGTYPVIALQEEGHSKLEARLLAYNWSLVARANREADEFAVLAEKAARENRFGPGCYASENKISVCRSDTAVFSVLEEHYTSNGGAHPGISFQTRNIDVRKGREIDLWDAVTDSGHLAGYIAEALRRTPEGRKIPFFSDDLKGEIQKILDLAEEEDVHFILGYEGITFFFDPDVLAPYAAGPLKATLSYEEYAWLVPTEYRYHADNYIQPLKSGDRTPLSGFGRRWLGWTQEPGTEMESRIRLQLGEETRDIIITGRADRGNLLKSEGSYYLYLEVVNEKNRRETYVFGIDPEKGIDEPLLISRYMEGGSVTDPDHMTMYSRGNLISSYICSRTFHAGADGLPVPNDPFEQIEEWSNLPLVLRQDLYVSIVDERSGSRLGSERLPAGTFLTPVRTDNQSFIDMNLSDGRMCRIYVNTSDGMQTVEGLPAEDVFVGLSVSR